MKACHTPGALAKPNSRSSPNSPEKEADGGANEVRTGENELESRSKPNSPQREPKGDANEDRKGENGIGNCPKPNSSHRERKDKPEPKGGFPTKFKKTVRELRKRPKANTASEGAAEAIKGLKTNRSEGIL